MTDQNLDIDNVHVFNEGKSMKAEAIELADLKYVKNTINIGPQTEEILKAINYLAKTVNKNAFCLKNLMEKEAKKTENLDTAIFVKYIHENNQLLENFINSPENLKSIDQNSNVSKQDVNNEKQIKEINTSNSNLSTIMEKNKLLISQCLNSMHEMRLKMNIVDLKTNENEAKWGKINKDIEELKLRTSELINELKSATTVHTNDIKTLNSELENQLAKVKSSIETVESRLKTELKFVTQRIDEANRVIRTQSDLGNSPTGSKKELFSKYLEVAEFRKFQELNKQLFDILETKLNGIEQEPKSATKEEIEEKGEIKKISQSAKIAQKSILLASALTTKKTALEMVQEAEHFREIEEKIYDVERNLSKKIIGIDSRLKEIEEIKKINKLVTRIQMELNLKINKEVFDSEIEAKLSRNDFFDFVNKNLISVDKIKTIEFQFLNLSEELEKQMKSIGSQFKIAQTRLDKISDVLTGKDEDMTTKFNDQLNMITDGNDKAKFMKNEINELTKKFEDMQNTVFELINVRLKSLATTKPICCLSCGAKDINYPPIEMRGEGERRQIYLVEDPIKEVLRFNEKNKEVKKSENGGSNKFSAITGKKKLENETNLESNLHKNDDFSTKIAEESYANVRMSAISKNSSHAPFKIRTNQYTTGEKVFSRELIVKEHTEQRHLAADFGEHNHTLSRQKERPLSSIPYKLRMKRN